MKATQKTLSGMLDRALRQARVFYFCGADEAGAGDAAAQVLARLGEGHTQPTERVDFAGADLKRDPVLLSDEARSASLFGDRRVLFVTMAGDEAHDAIATLIADPVVGWPVLVLATGATDKSRVARLLADRDDALVSVFYPAELRAVAATVRTFADAAGLRLGTAMAETIANAAGLDTRIVRSEVEKLALYLDASPESPRTASPADLAAIGTETVDDSMNPLVNATLGGMVARLRHELPRVASGDINPVGLLLAFERRAVQLAQLAARAGSGGNLNSFLDAEIQSRRVFFRDKSDLMLQLHKWRGVRMERLLNRLALLHRALLTDSVGAPLRMRQAIVEIARVAAR
jgi:DNA polymerase-3 subunit delta